MRLSDHFTLEELLASDTAKAKGIDNTPTDEVVRNLQQLAENVLEPARVAFGKPIRISSGYRCQRLNAAVGGKSNSQHLKGQAADLQVSPLANLRPLYNLIKKQGRFDQLLFERSKNAVWIHVSYNAGHNRGKAIDDYQA